MANLAVLRESLDLLEYEWGTMRVPPRARGVYIYVGPSLVTGRVCRLGPLSADSVRTVRVCRFGLDLYSSADSDYELRAVCRLSPNPRGVLGVTKICRFGRSWDGHVVQL